MTPLEIAVRLGVALLLGALIGFKRQWRQRMAGLRTNALVSIGAAGFVRQLTGRQSSWQQKISRTLAVSRRTQ